MRIVYTTSERFMNQMINCIKLDRMQQFSSVLPLGRRSCSLTTSSSLERKGANAGRVLLYVQRTVRAPQKQIVISSDTPPKNTAGLVERLRSRFEWGLMGRRSAPDLETKMAILAQESGAGGDRSPRSNVRIFIATKTKSNVRELEGALVKLMAYSRP